MRCNWRGQNSCLFRGENDAINFRYEIKKITRLHFQISFPLYSSSTVLVRALCKEESLILLRMREWEANADGGGKSLWTPDVMLCKARVAPSPAAIPLQVSLTLCNWAGKGQERGPSTCSSLQKRGEAVGWGWECAASQGHCQDWPRVFAPRLPWRSCALGCRAGVPCKIWKMLSNQARTLYA